MNVARFFAVIIALLALVVGGLVLRSAMNSPEAHQGAYVPSAHEQYDRDRFETVTVARERAEGERAAKKH